MNIPNNLKTVLDNINNSINTLDNSIQSETEKINEVLTDYTDYRNEVFTHLNFTATEDGSAVCLTTVGTPQSINMQFSYDDYTWNDYTEGTVIELDKDEKVYFIGTNNTINTSTAWNHYHKFVMSGSIEANGNIMSLLDTTLKRMSVPEYCFFRLFLDCTSLKKAPVLPAVRVETYGYAVMFNGCSGLMKGPEVLPAEDLSPSCYNGMLQNCSSLIKPPRIKAKKLLGSSCAWMFSGCSGLLEAPELPAMQLGQSCYRAMFENCTSLKKSPKLPATVLRPMCYGAMFKGCSNLTDVTDLPAKTLVDSCYNGMFQNCTSLIYAPTIYAETLVAASCSYMFSGDTALKNLEVHFTDWISNNGTYLWMDGVGSASSAGLFICPEGLDTTNKGTSAIPAYWNSTNI